METLDLIFMMNVSVVRASFKVFNLLSVADKSNINTFIFKNHCIIEKKMFFFCLMKANYSFLKVANLKMLFYKVYSL